MLVVGAVGSGKTVAMRHILLQQFYRGAAIILIDLNGDYKDFCKTLGGCWIDADSDYVTCPPEVLSAQLLVFDLSDLNRATDEFRFSHYSKVLSWVFAVKNVVRGNWEIKVTFWNARGCVQGLDRS